MFLMTLYFSSLIIMVDSTQEILTPITNNVLNVISENADIEINDNVRSFIDETAIAESGGEENPLVARNPLTNAGGKFQFIESENNNSLTTGLNRLSATKEDGSYVYFDKLPEWINETKKHKDVTKLNKDQQTALFLANLHQQKGTDDLFKKISGGDIQAKIDMYIKHHHKGKIVDDKRVYDDTVINYAKGMFI